MTRGQLLAGPGLVRMMAHLVPGQDVEGPAPVLLEWSDEDGARPLTPGEVARLRSRSLRVDAADDLLAALRELVGPDRVHLVRTS